MKPLLIIISSAALISVLLNIKFLYDRFNSAKQTFKVIEVIDGDTFRIEEGKETRRVKLIGVNTPEAGKCFSSEAKDKLTELVSGKEIRLEDQFLDPYGRIMANVFVGNKYINRAVLSAGLGRMDYYENPRKDELKEAYRDARSKKLGVFSGSCISTIPPISKSGIPCSIKGNIDDNTQKKIYFLPSCRNYSQVTIDLSTDDHWFCTEEEAITSSFTKSRTCD